MRPPNTSRASARCTWSSASAADDASLSPAASLPAVLEELHRALVPFGRRAVLECAQVPAPARLRIQLPGIQTVASILEFPDHGRSFPFCYGNSRTGASAIPFLRDPASV